MCRSIKKLRWPETPASPEEISAAATQYVRKVSGYRHPSKVNQEAFATAIAEVSAATDKLLATLTAAPR